MTVMDKTILTAALLSTMTLAGCVNEKRHGGDALPPGAAMPGFSVSGPDAAVSSDDLAGAPSVVVFFRTTCPDCSREMPNVEEAFRRVAGSGVRFVCVSKEDDAAVVVPEYWARTGMTMPYYYDPAGGMFTAFGVRFVPTLYLFDSEGKVAWAAVETFGFTVDELVGRIEGLR
ncbi:MAG: TlpA family protein disulfide reductase [Alistipes sp.]|jgi:peroxiredoxin|nr:TlpA family protein disulfide reductase [Alistipes sp.]